MIDKLLYKFVTTPASTLAVGFGAVLLVMVGAVVLAQGAGARTPQPGAVVPRTALPTPGPGEPTAQKTTPPTPVAGGNEILGTTVSLNGWDITLKRVQLRQCVTYRDPEGKTRVEKQPHYMVWVDALNNSDATRSLRRTIVWSMHTEGDHTYYARLDQDQETSLTGTWVEGEGREYLSLDIVPGDTTHPLLAFRTYSFKPLTLMVSTVEARPQVVAFDLSGLTPETSSATCE
jgi:hypothetical protein